MDLLRDLSGIRVHEVPYLTQRRAPASAPRAGGAHASVQRWEWLKTVTRRVRFSLGMFADLRQLAYFPMVRRGLALARERSFDMIVATSPPETVLFVARTLSRRTGIPWVADFRDLWFRDMILYRSRVASWLSGVINRWLIRSAAALVTVSRGLQQRLARVAGREVLLVYNGFFEAEHDGAAAARPWRDDRLHIAYTGRVYPGRQDPTPLFRALAQLRRLQPDLPQRLAVDFYGFDAPWLGSIVAQYGVQDCVALHGFVPYRESINVQHAADVLLFLDWTDPQAEGMLTGKLFEYVGSRRPILALGVRKDSEAARLIQEAGCGITLVGDEEIVDYLRQLLASPSPAVPRPEAADAFSRERQARTLLADLTQRLF
jgi:glycosyltransferase involved in cell wall biosynthesis